MKQIPACDSGAYDMTAPPVVNRTGEKIRESGG